MLKEIGSVLECTHYRPVSAAISMMGGCYHPGHVCASLSGDETQSTVDLPPPPDFYKNMSSMFYKTLHNGIIAIRRLTKTSDAYRIYLRTIFF